VLSIGSGARNSLRCGHPTSPEPVLYNHRLSLCVTNLLAQHTGQGVEDATWRDGNDYLDRPRRLRPCTVAAESDEDDGDRGEVQELTAPDVHNVSRSYGATSVYAVAAGDLKAASMSRAVTPREKPIRTPAWDAGTDC
jgi:hypothetical protein